MLKKLLLPLIATLAFTTNAWAVAPFYKIDLIVFSHITPQGLNSEQWPMISNPSVPIPSQPFFNNILTQNLNQLAASQTTNDSLTAKPKLLTADDSILKNEQARLDEHPTYKTLLHITWLQPTAQLDQKVTLHIYGGNLYDNGGNIIGNATGLMAPYDETGSWELNGVVSLYLDRFFNFSFNLMFTEPTKTLTPLLSDNSNQYFASNPSTLTYFRLLASRRMRSNELNYIDHPLYGVLIEATPVQNQTAGNNT